MKLLVAVAVVLGASVAHADTALPDPTERLLRWPLSQSEHPELAPRYDVAKDLAEPGLDWIELCKMGVHKRTVPSLRDQTAYLGAWCAIANHDVDTGVTALQLLMSSRVRGLSAAIRVDLGNVLANEGTVDRARRLIAKHQIDVVVLDRLVALFIDMNKLAEASEINDLAIGVGDHVPNACERQARRIVMNPDAYRGPGIDRRRLLHGRGAVCDDLEAELGCWLDLGRCGAFFKGKGRENVIRMFDVYRFPVGSQTWKDEIYYAIERLKSVDELSIAIDAIEREAKPNCPDPLRTTIRFVLWRISYGQNVPDTIKERIVAILDEHPLCGQ